MTTEAFIEWRPIAKTELLVNRARRILGEYDHPLTLKQLFARLVDEGAVDGTKASYERVSDSIAQARLAGSLDWDSIEDGLLAKLHGSIAPHNVEVWIEAEALVPFVREVLKPWGVPVLGMRGTPPLGVRYRAAKREALIIHLSFREDIDVAESLRVFSDEVADKVRIVTLPAAIEEIDPDGIASILRVEMREALGEPLSQWAERDDEATMAHLGEANRTAREEWGRDLRAILDEVGDTTRAKSLKDRIRKALGDE